MMFPILSGFLLPSPPPPRIGNSAADPALECVDAADKGPGGGVTWLPLNGASWIRSRPPEFIIPSPDGYPMFELGGCMFWAVGPNPADPGTPQLSPGLYVYPFEGGG